MRNPPHRVRRRARDVPASTARWVARLVLCSLVLGGAVSCGPAPEPPRNVLLITIDTLRADRLGSYGHAVARTPHLDRLASEGVRADDAVTVAPLTLPSHSTILTGLLPPAHGVRDNGAFALGDDATTLAERLRDAGFATHAVVSAVVLDARYNLDQGFDGYDDRLWAENDPKLFMIRDRPARRTAAHAVEWLDAHDAERPFFLWVHFFDPHQPLEAPADLQAVTANAYDAEVAAADRGVGTILDALERRDALDDTLVVMTSDHGESLGEHGEKTHGVFVYDATMRVPLILRHPGSLPEGRVYDAPVRTADIVPTVLGLLGLPGGDETQGVDLVDAFRGDVEPPELPQYVESMLSEIGFGMAPLHGVRSDGYKWIRAPKPELYDLQDDPGELNNLVDEERRRAVALDRELDALFADSRERALGVRENPMDRETLESLRALGYLAEASERRAMDGIDPKDGMALYAKLEEARHLAQREEWSEAEVLLREIVAETPRNLSAQNILALVLLRQDRVDEAIDEYLRSLALEPDQARVYAMLGTIALRSGRLDDAERYLEQALDAAPDFVEAVSHLGVVAMLRGDPEGAEAWQQRALAIDPAFPHGHRRLADLLFEAEDWQAAYDKYRRALDSLPEHFQTLVQAAAAARRAGSPETAAEHLETAAALRPDLWVASYNLACLHAVEGRSDQALEQLREAIDRGMARPSLLRTDEDLESLRALPAFEDLVAEATRAAEESHT